MDMELELCGEDLRNFSQGIRWSRKSAMKFRNEVVRL